MQLDTISHNLANVSTNGYKRSHAVFEDLLYQNMRQAGGQETQQDQLPTGCRSARACVRRDCTAVQQGNLQQTGNTFDMAIDGNGFFSCRCRRQRRLHARWIVRVDSTASSSPRRHAMSRRS